MENEGPAAGWPPGQILPRKSGWEGECACALLPAFLGRRLEETLGAHCSSLPRQRGPRSLGRTPHSLWKLLSLPPSLMSAVFAKAQCPHLCILPSSTPEKTFFWSVRLGLFCILSHLMFTWQLPPPKPRLLSRCLLGAGARPKCLRTFLLPCPLNGCTDLEDTAEFTNEETKAGSG